MKKRITSILVILSMVFSVMPFFCLPAFAADPIKPTVGDGSPENPYRIETRYNLEWFRDAVNAGDTDACAFLFCDINLSGDDNWTPIGTETYPYAGTFDGRNYTVDSLKINRTDAVRYGFFGTICNATIKNVHIDNGDILHTTDRGTGGLIGAVTGANNLVSNCSFVGNIRGKNSKGGLIGVMLTGATLDLENSYTAGTVDVKTTYNQNSAGGLIGFTNPTSTVRITKCYSIMDLSAAKYAGGLIARVAGGTMHYTDCYFAGTLTGSLGGGISGYETNSRSYLTRVHHYVSGASLRGDGDTSTTTRDYDTARRLRSTGDSGVTTNRTYCWLSPAQFKSQSSFPSWDFKNVWKLEDGVDAYPTLRQFVAKAEGDDAVITLYNTDDYKTVLIPDYFDLVLAEDKDYAQYDNRFASTITSGDTVTKNVYDEETEEYADKELTLATASGDNLTIYGETGIGIYPITITEVDSKDKFGTITLNLTAVIREAVPKPEVLDSEVYYSRYQTLGGINITEGWSFDDYMHCPKDGRKNYAVSYQCADNTTAENWDTIYDVSALTNAGITATYDATTKQIKAEIPVTILQSETSQRPVEFTVIDEDTLAPLDEVLVSTIYEDEFELNGHRTDEDGKLVATISPPKSEVTFTLDGYDTKTETIEIDRTKTTNYFTIKLRPTRTKVKAPNVKELGEDGVTLTDIKNPVVSVTRISDEPTLAWLGEATSMTADSLSELELPPGDFVFRNATYGYSTDDLIYARVADGVCTFYTDIDTPETAVTLADGYYTLKAAKLSEPTYNVTVDHVDKSLTYTVKVTLSNIKATYGTFGLHYDSSIMSLTNINYADDIDAGSTEMKKAEDIYAIDGAAAWNDDNGYYDFVWDARLDENEETKINAETGTEDIATFTFTLDKEIYEDYITAETFMVTPWQDTKAAKTHKKAIPSNVDDEFWEYFRYVDKDNNPSDLKEGRIASTKSAVQISDTTPISTSVETNGFFQANVPQPAGSDKLEKFYDVKTVIKYNFKIKNAVLRFHVYDKYSGDDLEKARIRLFDDEPKLVDTKYTDYAGQSSFAVKPEKYNSPLFGYDALLNGYWPVPESGVVSDRPTVTAETAKITQVEVPMEQKVYHKPVLMKDKAEETQLEIVTDAMLGGQKYAYNGRDYHFRVKAAKGYKITEYPTKATVYVDDTELVVDMKPSPDGLFTLKAQELDRAKYDDLRALEDSELAELNTSDPDGYGDWVGPNQPDEEGFRGYNIVVKFDQFKTEELEYKVEGVTNTYGHVAYAKDSDVDCDITSTDNQPPPEYILVQTKNTEHGGPNHHTGTFTFTGDTLDDVVERVYINGLEVDTYNDMNEFTYTFGEVDMDCNITVIFRHGDTPSDDTVMTLVVGEYGFADVKTPVEENDVMLTRRVYLNPTSDLTFEAHAMKGFELYRVEKEVQNGEVVNITDAAKTGSRVVQDDDVDITYTAYKVTKPTAEEQNITVYVTFMHPEVKVTPNLFVKSYVRTGTGVVNPAGILIYSRNDTVEIDLTTKSTDTWMAKGVMLSPFEELDTVEAYEFPTLEKNNTYRYDTLTESIAIGAVFVEKGYPVEGYIDLGQNGTASADKILTGATVRFVRLDDAGTVELPKAAEYVTQSQPLRHDSLFHVDLPAGHWNVYVTKQGYVQYKITDFEMKVPANDTDITKFGLSDDGTVQHQIVPYIGSTKTGTTISLTDASGVKSGMRSGLSAIQKSKADVDNDDSVTVVDLAYVWFNYNRYAFEQPYSDFKVKGSLTKQYVEE